MKVITHALVVLLVEDAPFDLIFERTAMKTIRTTVDFDNDIANFSNMGASSHCAVVDGQETNW